MRIIRRENNKYIDCFFLGHTVDMGAYIYDCKMRKTRLEKCPENCPYCMSTERALQTLREMLEKKNG